MFVLLGLLMLVVDTGSAWVARHQAQVAADSGALGAAQDLTGGAAATGTSQDTSASSDGTSVAQANDPGTSVQVTTPYNGDATTAQVSVSKSVALPFGFTASVSATAVAKNNIVVNGSFNSTVTSSFIEYCAADGVTTEGPYSFSCPTASPSLNAWTVYSGGVDLNDSSYIAPPASDPTAQSLDLVGSCNYDSATYSCVGSNCPSSTANGGSSNNVDQTTSGECQTNGEIYEPLNTVIGGTYTVNFDLSANGYGGPTNKLVTVWVSPYNPTTSGLANATDIVTNPPNPLVGTANAWTHEGLTFTATASTTYLWFVSNEGCVANNAAGTVTAPNAWTAVAPNCRYGAAITDISVTGPSSDALTQ